jgi:hypothetical protein
MDRLFLIVITSALLVLGTAATILVAHRNDKAVSLIRAPPPPKIIPPPAHDAPSGVPQRHAPGERARALATMT